MENLSFLFGLFLFSLLLLVGLFVSRTIRLKREKKTQMKIALKNAKNRKENPENVLDFSSPQKEEEIPQKAEKKTENTKKEVREPEVEVHNTPTPQVIEKNTPDERGEKKEETKTPQEKGMSKEVSSENIQNETTNISKPVHEEKAERNEKSSEKQESLLDKKNTEEKTEKKQEEDDEKNTNNQPSISFKEIAGLMARAEILMSQRSFLEAEKILVEILAYDNNHMRALEKLGEIYLENQAYSKSLILYENLLERRPEDPCVHTNYALSLLHEKNLEKAIEHYEKAAEIEIDNPVRHANLGQVFFTVKNYDGALECFSKAVSLKPRNPEYLYLVADTYRTINRYPEAKIWYEKILSVTPYDPEAQKEIERLQALEF